MSINSNESQNAGENPVPVTVTYSKGCGGVRMNVFRFDENGEEIEYLPIRGEAYDEAAVMVDDAVSQIKARVLTTVAPREVRMSGRSTDQINEVDIEINAGQLSRLRELSLQYAKQLRAELLANVNSYSKNQWGRWESRAAAEVLDDTELVKAAPQFHNRKVYLRAAELVSEELDLNDPDREKLLNHFKASAEYLS